MRVICNYCNEDAVLVKGISIYPHLHKVANDNYWQCANCNAYAACNPNTTIPLGILANKELRQLRIEGHKKFDALWGIKKCNPSARSWLGFQQKQRNLRSEAYTWLADKMQLQEESAHFSKFTEAQCKIAIAFVEERIANAVK